MCAFLEPVALLEENLKLTVPQIMIPDLCYDVIEQVPNYWRQMSEALGQDHRLISSSVSRIVYVAAPTVQGGMGRKA